MGLVEPVSPAYRSLRSWLATALNPVSGPDSLMELLRGAATRLPVTPSSVAR